ncbi:MAG: methionyl-tRNA formyltransferase [Alphaproteobacteria bacterium]
MRLAFFGTPEFSLPPLKALLKAGHELVRVYTQPPRPGGRGQRARPSAVQRLAESHGLETRAPTSLKEPAEQESFASLRLDAAVVCAYGLILPASFLAAPRLGSLNIHASLLPRWRGAAPIQRAIMAGDDETGVTIILMDEGLDTGPIVLAETVPLTPATTGGALHDTLSTLGARLMVEALAGLAEGRLEPHPQPREGVTYARKLERADCRLDWNLPAPTLERLIRALNPSPGAWCGHGGERLKVLAATVVAGNSGALPGTVLDEVLTVACGSESLRLENVQRAGRATMAARDLLRGYPIRAGERLD